MEPELKTGLGRDWDVLIEALLAERESSDADALHDALEVCDVLKFLFDLHFILCIFQIYNKNMFHLVCSKQ